ncbi:MAG: M56 family metallopeptidase [Gemmatimonadaceae bacterium]
MRSRTCDAAGGRPAYLVDAVALCEARRRQTLVWGTVALAALSVAPVFAHHLERGSESVLGSTTNIGEVCLVALHQMLAPVHTLFHLVLLAGLIYAVYDRVVYARRTRWTLSQLEATVPTPGDIWWCAAEDAGIHPSILRIVDGLPNPAFTVGWLRPRVYLASALATTLSPDELSAVLAHEGAHVARRDPLRLSAYRFLACVFFWIPAFRRMADDVIDETEIQADDAAAGSATGVCPLVLASALVSVASWVASATDPTTASATLRGPVNTRLLPGAVGFAGRDLLARRVRRLAGEAVPVESHVTRRSVIAAVAALALVWTSGIIVAHPLAAQRVQSAYNVAGINVRSSGERTSTMNMDCTRHGGFPLFHIFCLEDAMPCPHAR